MDLNFKRRKREREVAHDVAEEFWQRAAEDPREAAPERLAHHFASVCERRGFMPTEDSTKRIFGYVAAEISRRRKQFDQVAAEVERRAESAENLLAKLQGKR